jgi:hypothetical protein
MSPPSESNSLFALRPDLAREWHPTKNGRLNPRDVTPESEEVAWWLCEKGHWWQASIRERAQGMQCTYCRELGHGDDRRLADVKGELLKEWHPTRNPNLRARDVPVSHPETMWWICSQGHEWQDSIGSRLTGRGCPVCGNVEPASAPSGKTGAAGKYSPSRNGRPPGANSRLAAFREAKTSPLTGSDLRKGLRYERPQVVLIEKLHYGVLGYAEMHNFSAGGMMLLAEFFVRPGEIVRIKTDKPLHASVSTTMTGRVIWCHNLESEEEASSPFGIGLSMM